MLLLLLLLLVLLLGSRLSFPLLPVPSNISGPDETLRSGRDATSGSVGVLRLRLVAETSARSLVR